MTSFKKLDQWYLDAIESLDRPSQRKEPEWHQALVNGDLTYQMTFRNDPDVAESADFLGKSYLAKALKMMKERLDPESAKEILRLHSKEEKCWYCPKTKK